MGEVHGDDARVGGGAAAEDPAQEAGVAGGGGECGGLFGESVELVCQWHECAGGRGDSYRDAVLERGGGAEWHAVNHS